MSEFFALLVEQPSTDVSYRTPIFHGTCDDDALLNQFAEHLTAYLSILLTYMFLPGRIEIRRFGEFSAFEAVLWEQRLREPPGLCAKLREFAQTAASRLGIVAWTPEAQEQQATRPAKECKQENEAQYVIRRSGDGWFIRAFGEAGHFRNLVGLLYIARLVQSAGKPCPAAALLRDEAIHRPTVSEQEAFQAGLSAGASRQPVLDEGALAGYRRELDEYDKAIAQAERDGDVTQAVILRQERQDLLERMQTDMGLGGKERLFGTDMDKLRQSVSQALKRAYHALRNAKPRMMQTAGHFEAFITYRDGDFIYEPVPPPNWQISL